MKIFAISLLLTLVFELIFAFLFGLRKKDLLLVFLVNIMTNPAAVLCNYLLGGGFWILVMIETVVIIWEGCYYKKYGMSIRHPFLLSVISNIVSYLMGYLLSH